MPDLTSLLRAGEGVLRHLAGFADDILPTGDADNADGVQDGVDVTIVFADIEGFSQLVADEGDDVASMMLDRLDDLVAQALAAHPSARLVKQLGDGMMLTVTEPTEALALTASLPSEFAALTVETPFPLRLRAGAHHGRVRPRGEDVIGYHVNVAARVASAAEGGQALVTRALLDAASTSDIVARPVMPSVTAAGVLEAKGVPERPPLFAVHPAHVDTLERKSGPALRRSA